MRSAAGMHYVISFESKVFDLESEEENPINPIKGKSVGEWMAARLDKAGVLVTEVDAEDWGWYVYATYQGNDYLVGFIGLQSESADESPEIIVQVDKKRSLIEWILRKNRMTEDDSFLDLVQSQIRSLPDVTNVEVTKSA